MQTNFLILSVNKKYKMKGRKSKRTRERKPLKKQTNKQTNNNNYETDPDLDLNRSRIEPLLFGKSSPAAAAGELGDEGLEEVGEVELADFGEVGGEVEDLGLAFTSTLGKSFFEMETLLPNKLKLRARFSSTTSPWGNLGPAFE